MTELVPAKFPTLLKSIVGVELKQHGFKQKSGKFIRAFDGVIDEVYFQRSQYNVSGYSQMFYLNLYSGKSDESKGGSIRLDHPSIYKFPDFGHIEPFNYDAFTTEQKHEYDQWYFAKYWNYSTEEELIIMLEKARDLILDKGFQYFDIMKNDILLLQDAKERKKRILKLESELNGTNKTY